MDFESRKGSLKRSTCRAWGLGSQGLVSDSYQRTSRSERTWLAAPALEWNEDRVPSGAAAFPLHSLGTGFEGSWPGIGFKATLPKSPTKRGNVTQAEGVNTIPQGS